MGRIITIDSATLMNKAFEIIEARWLFGVDWDRIQAVIHPQSIVHSLVTFEDNSVVAQMAVADMRIPIANALAYPDRIVSGADTLDLCAIGRLDFLHPDEARFPCIAVARDVATIGGTAPAIMNAANEVAVELFCQGKIRFTDIVPMIEKTVSRMPHEPIAGVDHVLEVDQRARAVTRKLLGQKTL